MTQIIILNSVNSRSGKSLMSAYLATVLSKNYKTALMDCGNSSKSTAFFAAKRQKINREKNLGLPIFDYFPFSKELFEKIRSDYDFVILDSPDVSLFYEADILLTMMSAREGLDSLKFKNSLYAMLVFNAKKQRAIQGKSTFQWLVVPNDDYDKQDLDAVKQNGMFLGFKLSERLQKNEKLSQGLQNGVTVLDMDLPKLKKEFDLPSFALRRNLKKIFEIMWQNK